MDELDGTVALVTGASSGIGAATARELARRGADVVLCARRTDRIDEVVAQIESDGARASSFQCDVTNAEEVENAVAFAVETYGRLDTVIANAGVMLLGPARDAELSDWEQMVNTNVLGLMYTAHASIEKLLASAEQGPRQVADLVLISSVAGRQARVGSGGYNATKFAVGALGEALRQEFTQQHLRVSLVEPGAVDTELVSHNTAEMQAQLGKRFENTERLTAEDIAATIGFIVCQPRHVAINEILIRPTEQQN